MANRGALDWVDSLIVTRPVMNGNPAARVVEMGSIVARAVERGTPRSTCGSGPARLNALTLRPWWGHTIGARRGAEIDLTVGGPRGFVVGRPQLRRTDSGRLGPAVVNQAPRLRGCAERDWRGPLHSGGRRVLLAAVADDAPREHSPPSGYSNGYQLPLNNAMVPVGRELSDSMVLASFPSAERPSVAGRRHIAEPLGAQFAIEVNRSLRI